jgi:phospholipid N-methyltransferase
MRAPELQDDRAVELRRFFRSWIRNPLAIGAVAPSGRLLAKMMAMQLRPGVRVLELGAGTGTLTQAILDAGVQPQHLHIVEQHAGFVHVLQRRFPEAHVVQADATALREHFRGLEGSFDFVISGLPLLLFSTEQKLALLAQAFALLRPEGVLRQFTYAGRCPVGRDLRSKLNLVSALIGIAPFNLPPAFVYRFGRA